MLIRKKVIYNIFIIFSWLLLKHCKWSWKLIWMHQGNNHLLIDWAYPLSEKQSFNDSVYNLYSFFFSFSCPSGSCDRGHYVFGPSLWSVSLILQLATNFNIPCNFWSMECAMLLFDMHIFFSRLKAQSNINFDHLVTLTMWFGCMVFHKHILLMKCSLLLLFMFSVN